ncbi:PqqD family protein [Streptomyces sp. NPDC058457]|uniref:PqqD family protein n=1 Tax=Streptomyces sp. NPDC058457 TaxID=3346507 RepID=UPI00365ED392
MNDKTVPFDIASDVVWIPGDGEVRLYDARSGEFQTLNATEAEIWLLLSEGRGADEIGAEMVRRHAGDDAVRRRIVERDVHAFLASLQDRGLVV